MQCNKCRRNAIFFQEYSGQNLCKQHFEADVEVKAKHEIRRNRWITPGDHIAVALSGDKSSAALLYFLKKLTSNRRDITISAISIDEGIAGYRDPKNAMRIAELLDTECIIGSFNENFGTSVDEITPIKGTLSCTYCRVLRNFLLNKIAREHAITKLALGQTLDERGVSVLKNLLRGNPEIIVNSEREARGKIPHIRPFISVPHKEVALYADLHIKGCDRSLCRYNFKPFEKDVQAMLNEFTIRHPATKYAVMNLGKKLAGACVSMADSISSCEQCGESISGICQSCRIINEVTANGT
ncbi:MAG TPA: ATP-binding protein [Methanoregula sp.]|nr:ATP-binding protein [Methanoregula sp.]